MLSSISLCSLSGEVIAQVQFSRGTAISNLGNFFGKPQSFTCCEGSIHKYRDAFSTFIKRQDVLVVGTAQEDSSVAAVIGLLHSAADIITFFLKQFTEDVLRDNFSTVHQILQEIFDYGFPLANYPHELESLIEKPTLEHKVRQMLGSPTGGSSASHGANRSLSGPNIRNDYEEAYTGIHQRGLIPTKGNYVPWRFPPSIRHTEEEILFDLIEYVDCVMNNDGKVVCAGVRGSLEVNSKLNGLPEVTLHLSYPEQMKHIGIHRCVKASEYDSDDYLRFVPPDGKFTLCQYMVQLPSTGEWYTSQDSMIPFYVNPQLSLQEGEKAGTFSCMVGWRGNGTPQHGPKDLHSLVIQLRLPSEASAVVVESCNRGTYRFDRQSGVLEWSIEALRRTTPSITGSFTIQESSNKLMTKTMRSLSARVQFEISNYTISQVGIRSLTVEPAGGPSSGLVNEQKCYKGIKYLTRGGNFVIRSG